MAKIIISGNGLSMSQQNAGDSIELIQTLHKFMLEIGSNCWSLQPNEILGGPCCREY